MKENSTLVSTFFLRNKTVLFLIISILFTSFKQRELLWVAIGDSITYLNDHLGEAGNRITKGYMTMVTEKQRNLHFINQGHNGWTSGGIADSIDKLGLVKADIYSVFLGTNDWWQGRPLGRLSDYQNNTGNGTVYGSFRIITDKLRSLNNEAKILLITPMQLLILCTLAMRTIMPMALTKKRTGLCSTMYDRG
jgi:hypothetical protein